MPATHFWDFTRDNGLPVTVEYSVEGNCAAPSYSPMHGADGGDAPSYCIIDAWPNTPGHDILARWRVRCWGRRRWRHRVGNRISGWLLRFDCAWRATLTDAERERFEAHIAEHHAEQYEDDYEDRR